MSQTSSTTQSPVDHEDWEQVLAQLRAEGFSPIESIKVTRAVLHVSLGEAKRIVHQSTAWEDAREGFDQLHDVAEAAAADL
jgi:ribosomal protein L7/L12